MKTNASGSATDPKQASQGRIYGDDTAVRSRSNDVFFHLIKGSPFGMFLIDANFCLVEFSEGCRKVFEGIDPLIGRDFAEILRIIWLEPFATEAIERFSHTLKTGEPYRSPGTTEKRANVAAVESYDWYIDRVLMPDGQFAVICHFYEATDRLEGSLRESQMQLENALKAGRMGAWNLDLSTGILIASDYCKSNFGRNAADEFTYDDLRQSIHPDDLDMWQQGVDAAIKNCGSFELEYRAVCPDRSLRWIAVVGNCYAGANGETATLAGITVDVTDRKLAERKLVEGIEFNQEIIDSLAAHISVLDQDGNILAVNESWRRFAKENGADWTMKGVGVETNYLEVCSKATCEGDYDAEAIQAGIEDVLQNRRDLFTIEYPCHSPTQRRWFLLSASPLRHMGGAVVSHTNITERRLAEEALRKSQERFDIVCEGAEIGFWFCDLPFDELVWDARVKEHFWLSPDARVTIETFYEQMHPDDRERTRRTIEDSIENKTRYNIDYRTVSPEGEVKWIRAIGRTFYDSDGEPVRFDGVTLDITDRRNAERVLRERELLESTLKFREAERLRIARDLHDQLGQQLTALRLTLADLINNASTTPDVQEKLVRAQSTALALDKDVSSLAFELRSNILTEHGLSDALSKFVADWSQNYEIEADFQMVGSVSDGDLTTEMETNLYRIVQEALNNATKHAKAGHVGVILDIAADSVRLIIEDDGVGFEPDSIRFDRSRKDRHGLGLKGMRERVDLMNGLLEIDSNVGRGTTIFVTVPRLSTSIGSDN